MIHISQTRTVRLGMALALAGGVTTAAVAAAPSALASCSWSSHGTTSHMLGIGAASIYPSGGDVWDFGCTGNLEVTKASPSGTFEGWYWKPSVSEWIKCTEGYVGLNKPLCTDLLAGTSFVVVKASGTASVTVAG
jgi:hypothetical protein